MHGKLPIRMCVHYRYCNEGIVICTLTFNSEQNNIYCTCTHHYINKLIKLILPRPPHHQQ